MGWLNFSHPRKRGERVMIHSIGEVLQKLEVFEIGGKGRSHRQTRGR